jgi:hypothetical protein
MKGGQARDILLYNKNCRLRPGSGEVDDLKYATAGAINFGFPVVATRSSRRSCRPA